MSEAIARHLPVLADKLDHIPVGLANSSRSIDLAQNTQIRKAYLDIFGPIRMARFMMSEQKQYLDTMRMTISTRRIGKRIENDSVIETAKKWCRKY